MTRSRLLALASLVLALGGCATSLASLEGAPVNEPAGVSDSAASPRTTPPSGPTNFGSATRPNFGPQDP